MAKHQIWLTPDQALLMDACLVEAENYVVTMPNGAVARMVLPAQLKTLRALLVPPAKDAKGEAVDEEIVGYLRTGRLINAIKRHREISGLGLKESKEYCEALRDRLGLRSAGLAS